MKKGDEQERLADRLHSAAIHLLRRVHKQDEESAVGPARLSALSVLVCGGPMSLGRLAAAERVKPPTMTRIVAGLKRSHLVEILEDVGDRRRVCIRATPEGTRILQQARHRRIRYLKRQLIRLRNGEIEQLEASVGILEEVLRNWQG
jgi:DNA-binding MarR family transcriptional regulator